MKNWFWIIENFKYRDLECIEDIYEELLEFVSKNDVEISNEQLWVLADLLDCKNKANKIIKLVGEWYV